MSSVVVPIIVLLVVLAFALVLISPVLIILFLILFSVHVGERATERKMKSEEQKEHDHRNIAYAVRSALVNKYREQLIMATGQRWDCLPEEVVDPLFYAAERLNKADLTQCHKEALAATDDDPELVKLINWLEAQYVR